MTVIMLRFRVSGLGVFKGIVHRRFPLDIPDILFITIFLLFIDIKKSNYKFEITK